MVSWTILIESCLQLLCASEAQMAKTPCVFESDMIIRGLSCVVFDTDFSLVCVQGDEVFPLQSRQESLSSSYGPSYGCNQDTHSTGCGCQEISSAEKP